MKSKRCLFPRDTCHADRRKHNVANEYTEHVDLTFIVQRMAKLPSSDTDGRNSLAAHLHFLLQFVLTIDHLDLLSDDWPCRLIFEHFLIHVQVRINMVSSVFDLIPLQNRSACDSDIGDSSRHETNREAQDQQYEETIQRQRQSFGRRVLKWCM